MNIVDLGPAAQRLADLVTRVGDDELGKPTPCPAYTLGDLIEHVGGLALAFTAAANKDSGRYVYQTPSGDASRLGEGWRVRIPRDLAALARAWRERAPHRPLPPRPVLHHRRAAGAGQADRRIPERKRHPTTALLSINQTNTGRKRGIDRTIQFDGDTAIGRAYVQDLLRARAAFSG